MHRAGVGAQRLMLGAVGAEGLHARAAGDDDVARRAARRVEALNQVRRSRAGARVLRRAQAPEAGPRLHATAFGEVDVHRVDAVAHPNRIHAVAQVQPERQAGRADLLKAARTRAPTRTALGELAATSGTRPAWRRAAGRSGGRACAPARPGRPARRPARCRGSGRGWRRETPPGDNHLVPARRDLRPG